MKRLPTIACLLLLASSASPRLSSGLMVELHPASIIRQETMLDRHSAIPVAEARLPLSPMAPFHASNDELTTTTEVGQGMANPENDLESHFVDPIYRLLQVKDIIAPVKPGKSRTARK